MTCPYTTQDVESLVAELEANDAQVKALQARNSSIRRSLAMAALGEAWQDAKGTQKVSVAGVPLKIEFKQDYKVDANALKEIAAELSDAAKSAIKYKPELSLSVYKVLSAEDRAALNKAVTSKPGLPTVSKVF